MAARRRRRGRRQRLGKVPAKPRSLERSYAKGLLRIIGALKPIALRALARLDRARADSVPAQGAFDDEDDDGAVTRAFAGTKVQFDKVVKRAKPGLLAQGVDAKVTAFAVKSVDGSVRGVMEVAPSELAVPHRAFIKENVALIKSISDDLHGQVVDVVEDGWSKGRTNAAIATDIQERFGVAENRARLIARDQVGSLNAKVSEARQKELGIEQYRWSTSLDERVRGNPSGLYPDADPSHFDREGELFSWDDPPEDGHPGIAVNCRCVAIAVLPDEDDE